MTRPRTKQIEIPEDPRGGAATQRYRIQPMLPIGIVFAGGSCVEADFTVYDGMPCVEALVRLGTIQAPYTIVMTIEQALEADIVERV